MQCREHEKEVGIHVIFFFMRLKLIADKYIYVFIYQYIHTYFMPKSVHSFIYLTNVYNYF